MAEDTSWMSDPTTYADPYKQMGTAYTTEARMSALERYRQWLEQQYKIADPTKTMPASARFTRSGGSSGYVISEADYNKSIEVAKELARREGYAYKPGTGKMEGWKGIQDVYASRTPETTTHPWKAKVAAMPTSQNLYDQYFGQYKAQKPQMGGRGSGRNQAYIDHLRGSVFY